MKQFLTHNSSVFISYSWKDREIVQSVISPLLRDNGIDYFIDYEYFDIEREADSPLQQYIALRGLERLYNTTAFKPWQENKPSGKPLRWLAVEIEKEIAKKEIHLVFMSQFSSKSFWVNREVDYSISLCKKILVVRLDNSLMPDRLSTLINCQLIPCFQFSGDEDTPILDSFEDYIAGWYSSEDEKKKRSIAFDAFARHGVVYRKPTKQDRIKFINELKNFSTTNDFDFSHVNVGEIKFDLNGVPFQFVAISGAPYFSKISILKTPITIQQYRLFDEKKTKSNLELLGEMATTANQLLPMTSVSWYEAKDYCEWLSKQTNHTIRLPYEVEWEFACRAGSTTKYHFGDDDSLLNEYAWYNNLDPQIVGTKKPNQWGLYDMHGNVGEWCFDKLDVGEIYSIQTPSTFGRIRVFRGGAGSMLPETCRSGYRYFDTPDSFNYNRGFRLLWKD
jgi:hypothetical protein